MYRHANSRFNSPESLRFYLLGRIMSPPICAWLERWWFKTLQRYREMEFARWKRESKRASWRRLLSGKNCSMILKVLENIPAQFSRYEIIDNQLIVSPSDRIRAFTSKKLIRASCRSEKEREEIGQTTICVITFSKQILFAKIARLRRLHRQLRAVLYLLRTSNRRGRGSTRLRYNAQQRETC